jgi:hypothetical protein
MEQAGKRFSWTATMNIQQEVDSLFETALALLHESSGAAEDQPARRKRLQAWKKKFRSVERAISAQPSPRQMREDDEQTPENPVAHYISKGTRSAEIEPRNYQERTRALIAAAVRLWESKRGIRG